MSDLVLQDITKTFGATVAVEELSFKAEPGEFVCILGPSGCGKTTLLRHVAGFYASGQRASSCSTNEDVSRSSPPHKRGALGDDVQSTRCGPT